ncbi:ribonuclease H-like domain-containing protein [Tanacetum coccineum]
MLSVQLAAHWVNYSGSSVRECRCTSPFGAKCRQSGRRGSWKRLGPSLTCVPTWIPIAGHKSMRASNSICKRSTMARGLCSKDWDAQVAFWNDPKNLTRAAQNKQNRAKSKVVCRQGSRSIAALRDMHMECQLLERAPVVDPYLLFDTYYWRRILEPWGQSSIYEMVRLQGLGSNTETAVPYTEDEIMAIFRGGKQRGHIPGVGKVLSGQGTLFRSDDKFSQMLTQHESQPEIGSGSGSGGCGDDEPGDDEDRNENGEDEDDKLVIMMNIDLYLADNASFVTSFMDSDRWPQIYAGIQQHLQKIYNARNAAQNSEADGMPQVAFWNDPKNLTRAAQNKQNRAKSKVVCRQGSRSIAALRDMHMESSATREYPSLIHTFFLTHTIGGEFVNPEDKALYARSDDKFSQMLTQLESHPEYGGGSGSGGCEDDDPVDDEDGGEDGEDEDDS